MPSGSEFGSSLRPSARATVSAPQVPAAKRALKSAGRKRKPGSSPQRQLQPLQLPRDLHKQHLLLSLLLLTWWRAEPHQSRPTGEIQRLTVEVGQARAFGERTYDQLQQEKQSNAEQLERLTLQKEQRGSLWCS
ncbi:TPA: hypothetical protein ACH3X1_011276 [Trebouxia sp. C0004]